MFDTTRKCNWIIAIGGSAIDGVLVKRVFGTQQQVAEHLFRIVETDRNNIDCFVFDFGTKNVNDICLCNSGALYAYSSFNDCHIDYIASPEGRVINLPENDVWLGFVE